MKRKSKSNDEILNQSVSLITTFMALGAEFNKHIKEDNPLRNSVLKCHLIIEHFMDKVLADAIPNYKEVRNNLGFALKVKLLPRENKIYKPLIPKLKIFNGIRNQYIHNLTVKAESLELEKLKMPFALEEFGSKVEFSPEVLIIEDFTKICCLSLMFYSKELKKEYSDLVELAPEFDNFISKFNSDDWI